MMENMLTEAPEVVISIAKIEMDQSYENGGESGVFSQGSTSANETTESWEFFEDEISDPEKFDPPILNSTNLEGNKCRIMCSISSIEGESSFLGGKFRSNL